MSDAAHVRSSEAIDAFRTRLLLFGSKAKPLLEDIWDEVGRTREWIRMDRRMHWENEVRRCRRKLDDAQQAYFSARASNLREATSAEQSAIHKARRALTAAEEKLRRVKQWCSDFDNRAMPLLKQLEHLQSLAGPDLTKAAGLLGRTVAALDAYAEAKPGPSAPSTPKDPA